MVSRSPAAPARAARGRYRHPRRRSWRWLRAWGPLLVLLVVVGLAAVLPPLAEGFAANEQGFSHKDPGFPSGGFDPLAQRKVPGPSPQQTIRQFLQLTDQAEALIRRQIRLGLAEPGLFFSPAIHRATDGAEDSLLQANEALNLSQVPIALRPMTGVGTMLMLRSVLRYDLDHSPGLVIPDAAMVGRDRLQSWTLPETPISLRAISDRDLVDGRACRRCSAGDFLFSAQTLDQVPEDFWRIFGSDPSLRRRYGADMYIYWAQVPGEALPPKPFLQLPLSVRRFLLTPIAGQSLLQWLLLLPVTLAALLLMVWWLLKLRRWRQSQGEFEGAWPHLVLVIAVLPPLLLVGFWQWYAINWINLIGPREAVVLVGSRLLTGLLQALLVYLLAEAVGQLLILRRQADADGTLRLTRRKGSGQILTLARTGGILGVLALGIQTAQALGFTSLTLLAVSSVPALALSLGTQQLIRDVADGFSLWLDGQIRPGDPCTVGSSTSAIQGQISSLGMRSVRLHQDDGTVLSIPNSQVASAVVANHRSRSSQDLTISLPLPSRDPDAVASYLEQVRGVLGRCPELGNGEAALEVADDGWTLKLSGRWSANLAAAERQTHRERLLLELLRLEAAPPSIT